MSANETRRAASPPILPYDYLIPGSSYTQLWDWDSVFLGIGTLRYGSRPYLLGSMKNFFSNVNLATGYTPGCLSSHLDPSPCSIASKHAKPVLVQGAWIASEDKLELEPFRDRMRATLEYWDRAPHTDPETRLFVWSDQMETGADDLPLSQCPSWRSPGCWSRSQANTLASVDLQIWLSREHLAFSKFIEAWDESGESDNVSLCRTLQT